MKKLTVCLVLLLTLVTLIGTFGVYAEEANAGETEETGTGYSVTYEVGVYDKEGKTVDKKVHKVEKMPDDETGVENLKLPAAPERGKNGRNTYAFAGWMHYDENGNAVAFYPYEDGKYEKDNIELSSNATLIAVWSKTNGGFWKVVLTPFSLVMKGCAWLVKNKYALAIFLFALIFKIVLFPFGIKQQKNSVKMAKLAPKQAAIQKKYNGRDDQASRQKMQQEIMEMQQKEGYNPLSGCGPMLLQLVLVIALYQVIRFPLTYLQKIDSTQILSAVRGYYAWDELSLIGVLQDPAKFGIAKMVVGDFTLPDFRLFGIDLSIVPQNKIWWYILIPVIVYAGMVFSTKLTRKLSPQPPQAQTADQGCSMKMMDYGMPLMSAYFAFIFPAILGVYWVFQNILGIVQQVILKAMYPAPVFTEEDYKEEERRLRTKKSSQKSVPAATQVTVNGKQYRSLHHIDDEPDDVPQTAAPKAATKPSKDAPKLKDDK